MIYFRLLISFTQDEGADLPFAPPMKGSLFLVPNGIRPVMQRTAIEVYLNREASLDLSFL